MSKQGVSHRDVQRPTGDGQAWLVLAGGVAALVSVAWAIRTLRSRSGAAVGAHAWLVPIRQAQTEAQWTRQALVHSSASKG